MPATDEKARQSHPTCLFLLGPGNRDVREARHLVGREGSLTRDNPVSVMGGEGRNDGSEGHQEGTFGAATSGKNGCSERKGSGSIVGGRGVQKFNGGSGLNSTAATSVKYGCEGGGSGSKYGSVWAGQGMREKKSDRLMLLV